MTRNLINKSKRTTKTPAKAAMKLPSLGTVWVVEADGELNVFRSRDAARSAGLGTPRRFVREDV